MMDTLKANNPKKYETMLEKGSSFKGQFDEVQHFQTEKGIKKM